jgi:hypothetical protein
MFDSEARSQVLALREEDLSAGVDELDSHSPDDVAVVASCQAE